MKVLVVDDHALFRDGIISLLRAKNIQVVGEASDGLQAVIEVQALRPDIVLMDIRMPGMGGLEATRLIKSAMPAVKIVILTVSDDDEDLFEAIKSGADGYFLKNLRSQEFFRLLAGIPHGEAAISPNLATKILREFARSRANESHGGGGDQELTERERGVLEFLAQGSPNKEIAEALFITEHTVKYHVKNIMGKLHLRNRAQVVAYAARRGLGGTLSPDD